jgi:hypothetical protein
MSVQNPKFRINDFGICAVWGGRPETPTAIAARLINMLDRLKQTDPIFDNWVWLRIKGYEFGYVTEEEAIANMEELSIASIKDDLPAEIDARIARFGNGELDPEGGYMFTVHNAKQASSPSINIWMCAGTPVCDEFRTNSISLTTNFDADADPAIINFAVFKGALLAIAETFDAPWTIAYSIATRQLRRVGPRSHYYIGWISYVGPCFAPLINPPSTAIVERRSNGGLLMAATDEPFSIYTPAHVDAARDIREAVAPLNALPWPLPDDAQNDGGAT